MNYKRRDFLKLGSNIAAAMVLAPLACNQSANDKKTDTDTVEKTDTETGKKIDRFGLQLYTLRADFPKDPKGVLKQVAGYGYKQVESFEGPKGIFWGMTNKEFKEYLDSLDMKIVSSHCDITKDLEKKAAEAAAIDMKYLICPYLGAQKTLEDRKSTRLNSSHSHISYAVFCWNKKEERIYTAAVMVPVDIDQITTP